VYISPLQKWSDLRAVLINAQFTGALMRGSVFCIIVLVTSAIAGRWYCSVFCPFGTLQEAVWRAGRLVSDTRFVSPWRLRYLVPVLAGIGIAFTLKPLFLVTDPISNFGRGMRAVLTLSAEGIEAIAPLTWAMLGVFSFVMALALVRGRRFCDWCPVGILLGAFASVAPLGMRLKKGFCVSCGKCERSCPVNCVDSKGKTLDGARCVLCLSCAKDCSVGALEYGVALPAENAARRAFLWKSGSVLAWLAGAVYLGGAALRGVFPRGSGGKRAGPMPFIMPPGARDAGWFSANCIGCQACVAACPAKIIRTDRGPPALNYAYGYCQYNCAECSNVCPTGALSALGGMKERTRVGLSALDRKKCVVITKGESCGACAEVCAPRALRMEPLGPGSTLTAPVLDPEYCIGCGGCFHVCPAEPRAFVVTGVTPQVLTPGIRPSSPEEDSIGVPVVGDGFPF
jgi:ferredoxin